MYESFFGFRERPFDLTPNPKFVVMTESHQEALSNLQYGIASRKGITLLIGEAGSGKTTMIRTALDRQTVKVHYVHLHNPTLTRAEFAEMLAVRFGLPETAMRSKAAMLWELEKLLVERQRLNETTVLVLDEAQSFSLELLEEIRLLANIETDAQKLVSVVIAGQPELVPRLNDQSLRQLKQRIALRCMLRSLTLKETAAYIRGRIRAAGGQEEGIFTDEAVGLIHAHSLGLPRTISVIADNSLLGAFAAGRRPVDAQIVRDVCRDFDINPTQAPGPRRRESPFAEGGALAAGSERRLLRVEPPATETTETPPVPTGAPAAHTPLFAAPAPPPTDEVADEFEEPRREEGRRKRDGGEIVTIAPRRRRFTFFRS